MNRIPFTQYLMPDGRARRVYVERPDDIVEKAQAMIQAGYRFECEILITGHVSLTISKDEDTLAHEICCNGPAVPLAVDQLVSDATLAFSRHPA